MINFKQAKFNDYWRKANQRKYDCFVDSFVVNRGDILKGAQLHLKPGINIIAGKNGVGKSTLIGGLYNSTMGDGSNRVATDILLGDEDYSLCISIKNGTNYESVDVEDVELTSYLFDPCVYVPNYLNFLSKQDNIEELLEQVGSKSYTEEQLKNINYLTNSRYESVVVWNIEDEFADHPILPYFRVVCDGIQYDSKTMGLGELALIYFFWLIERISGFDEKSLLFVEEPESYLPPKTQKRLMNCIAWLAAEKGISVLISTHSEHVLSFVGNHQIHLMMNIDKNKMFVSDLEAVDSVLELGLQSVTTKLGLFSVEDRAAEIFLQALLGTRADYYSYEIAGSEGHLVARCGVFIHKIDGYINRAIFDGDSRGKFGPQLKGCNVNRYLPTDKAPDELLYEYFNNLALSDVADILSVSIVKMASAKEAADGADFHDYFRELGASLRLSEDSILKTLAEHWCDNHQPEVKEFLEEILK